MGADIGCCRCSGFYNFIIHFCMLPLSIYAIVRSCVPGNEMTMEWVENINFIVKKADIYLKKYYVFIIQPRMWWWDMPTRPVTFLPSGLSWLLTTASLRAVGLDSVTCVVERKSSTLHGPTLNGSQPASISRRLQGNKSPIPIDKHSQKINLIT